MFSIRRFLDPVHVVQPPAAFVALGGFAAAHAILASIAVTLVTPAVSRICVGDDPTVRR